MFTKLNPSFIKSVPKRSGSNFTLFTETRNFRSIERISSFILKDLGRKPSFLIQRESFSSSSPVRNGNSLNSKSIWKNLLTSLGFILASSAMIVSKDEDNWESFPYVIQNEKKAVFSKKDGVTKEYHTNSCASNDPFEDTHDELSSASGELFGIFDGHSGTYASKFCQRELLQIVDKHLRSTLQEPSPSLEMFKTKIINALIKGFLETDKNFFEACEAMKQNGYIAGASGACSIVAYFCSFSKRNNLLFVANAGDCRAVLGTKNGKSWTSIALSRDQTAADPVEIERLQREHPNEPDVVIRGRVKGSLQPSRGIGDGVYKKMEYNLAVRKRKNWHPPYTTAEPEVKVHSLSPNDSFLIIATDGLWDFLSNDEAVQIVGNRLLEDPNLFSTNASSLLIAEVFRRAIGKVDDQKKSSVFSLPGGTRRKIYDDVTVTVVFLNNETQ